MNDQSRVSIARATLVWILSHPIWSGIGVLVAVAIAFVNLSPSPQGPYDELIAKMYQWRDDPQQQAHPEHVERWNRALLAFGEKVGNSSLPPMTAQEAQRLVDENNWRRWAEVAEALRGIEAGRAESDDP